MPDAAREATERQFLSLLDAASGSRPVCLSLYTLPGMPPTRPYRCVEELLGSDIDGLIVTGTEPRHASLIDERYWNSLTSVIEWAENNTVSTVWSCLAAHAAVLHLDGIQRHRLPQKCFGVLPCKKAGHHELTDGLPSVISIPHSRWHDLSVDDLSRHGYQVLTRTNDSPDTFIKRGKSLFVFFQGHPEYDANTLLLEYRRDVRRYLSKESDNRPSLPRNYLPREMLARLAASGEHIVSERLDEVFPDFMRTVIPRPWESTGVRIYRNWLTCIHKGATSHAGLKARGALRIETAATAETA